MGNNRRERQKVRKQQEQLESKNSFGIKDPTPKAAVESIIGARKEKAEEGIKKSHGPGNQFLSGRKNSELSLKEEVR